MSVSHFLMFLNYTVVLFYGVILTASFADALNSKKDWVQILLLSLLLLIVQKILYPFVGMNNMEKLYPFIVHLPLALFLIFTCGKKPVITFAAVFLAYLCCIPRQWLGMLIASLFGRGTELSYLVQILSSLPLLAVTIRYVSPMITGLMRPAGKSALLLGAMPCSYYVFIYATTVYSQILYSGSHVIIGLMMSFLVLSYFVFAVSYSREIKKRSEVENLHNLLALQTEQALKELESMRLSQQQAATYRHDMRHHFQYVSACLDADRVGEAKMYIQELCTAIESQKIIFYCENEAVNLVLSSYTAKAALAGVSMDIQVTLSEPPHLPTSHLCVILSNALENALHACEGLPADTDRHISVQGYQKNGQTFFQIQNPYKGSIVFEKERPTTTREGHGIGTLSIIASVKQYGGLCSFSAEDGQFTLRLCV